MKIDSLKEITSVKSLSNLLYSYRRFLQIKKINLLFIIISLGFFSLLNLSCGPIYEYPTGPSKPTFGVGVKLRFANCSPGSPGLDLFINNQEVLSNATYKLVSYFFDLSPGAKEFKIRETGKSDDLYKDTLVVDSGKTYTLDAIEDFPSTKLLLTLRPSQYPTSGKSLVRFVHVAYELPAIDINLRMPVENFLLTNLNYKSASTYWEVIPNKGSIIVYDAGTSNIFFVSEANFEIGKIYTIYILGLISGQDSLALNANFLEDTNPNPQNLFTFTIGATKIRFINGDPESSPFQFFVDGSQLGSSVPFNQSTSLYEVKAGARKIKVNMGSTTALIDTVINFEQGNKYSVLVGNFSGNKRAVAFSIPDRTISGNRSLLRFINASTDLPSVNVKLTAITGTTIISNLISEKLSDYIEIATGQNIITLSTTNNPSVISSSAFFEGGKVYLAFLFGSAAGIGKNYLSLNFMKENDSTAQALFAFSQVQTNLRLINGSFDSPALNLFVDDVSTVSNLIYKNATKMIAVNTGLRKLTIKAVGYAIPIYESSVNFESNQNYVFYVANKFENIEVIPLNTSTKIVPFGKSSLRFINGVFDISGVDLKITNSGGTTSLNNIPFKDITSYLDLSAGKNEIIIKAVETQNTILTSEASLEVGGVYTAFFLGVSDGSGGTEYSLSFLKELNSGAQQLTEFPTLKTNLRFISGLTDNPSVDLSIDGTKIASSINYKLATSILKINSGNNRLIKIFNAGTTNELMSKYYDIEYTKNYSLLISNNSSNPDPILFENPSKTVPTGKSSLRIVHGASGMGNLNVSITNSGGKINISNIAYKSASNYIDLNSGSNEIVFTIAGSPSNIILTSAANLEADKLYTVYLLGNTSGIAGQELSINFLIESNSGSQFLFSFEEIKSQLRFINGSTDNPLLELSVDDNFVASNVNYKLATSVLKVNSGTGKKVKVFEFGSTAPLINQEHTLSHAKSYSLLITNKVTNLEALLFENPSKSVSSGKSAVRIVHGAYDHGPIDIYFTNSSGKYKISNVSYKGVSSYLDLNSGFNEIIVTASGSASNLVLAADATLEQNTIYTIYFLGNNSGASGEEYSLNFLNESDSGGQYLFNFAPSSITRFRTINASPNSPGLDVSIDDSKIIQNLLFGVSTGYLFIRSGIREIKAYAAGTTSPVRLNFNYLFEQGKSYTLLAMDSISILTPLLVEDLNYTPTTGKSYIRFINASPNSIPLDIKIGNPSGVVKHSYFTYQQITDYEPYDPAVMSFIFTESNTANEILSLRGFSLIQNKAYTIVVMGFRNGSPGQTQQVKWYQDN